MAKQTTATQTTAATPSGFNAALFTQLTASGMAPADAMAYASGQLAPITAAAPVQAAPVAAAPKKPTMPILFPIDPDKQAFVDALRNVPGVTVRDMGGNKNGKAYWSISYNGRGITSINC